MGKFLVVVESPTKAKTINKYLGNAYIVKSSAGHVRDLPLSSLVDSKRKKTKLGSKSMLVASMGIDPYNNWEAQYQILPGKEKVITELKALAKKANHIYLATDFDREGEAIAWHLREVIGGNNNCFSRVVFNEITSSAITHAFKNPGNLNIAQVNAQQARRFMDRIVGYMVSPLLWKKIARGLSAGRVQSVAVKLIVKREQEIKAFVPKEYWELYVNLTNAQTTPLLMRLTHYQEKPFKLVNQQQVQKVITLLKKTKYIISSRENKFINSQPFAPFTTSTLQQAASTLLGYGIKKTMMLAQQLYEAGLITYMRTNSTNLSLDALDMVRAYISNTLGDKYLPNKPNKYDSNKDNTLEAHEAIRPSEMNECKASLKDIKIDAQKLYNLIWCQFVASQMAPAQYNSTIITVIAGEFRFRSCCRTLCFDGWTKVMSMLYKGNEDCSLPKVKVGQQLTFKKVSYSQHFTKPPVRYSEASLVKELEKLGIGRPSTYVPIISSIQERGYVHIKNQRFYAEKIGEIVTNRLEENFCELMNYNFTAKMENALDQIATNQQEWKNVLDVFFNKFSQQLNKAEKDPEEGGMRTNQMVITSISCPICSRKMGIRTASTGVFLGCSGYIISSKERCKNTINLIPESEIFNIFKGDNTDTNVLLTRPRCNVCRIIMDSYIIDSQYKIHVCGNNPLCCEYKIEQGNFFINNYGATIIECEKCGSNMNLKLGRFGKYMACVNDTCKNTRKILRNGDIAPPKENPVPLPELLCKKSDAYFVLRNGVTGVFLAANTFPKSRETRAPFVEELARFRDRQPEKLRYLADAPIQDDEGNKTLVRFNREINQQYVYSEKEGKATGWTAFYVNGKWRITKK